LVTDAVLQWSDQGRTELDYLGVASVTNGEVLTQLGQLYRSGRLRVMRLWINPRRLVAPLALTA
jgi:hypothetical protein